MTMRHTCSPLCMMISLVRIAACFILPPFPIQIVLYGVFRSARPLKQKTKHKKKSDHVVHCAVKVEELCV
jgi:hypothetical protein